MFDNVDSNKLSSFKIMMNGDGLRVLKTKIFNRDDDYNFLCPVLLDNDNEFISLIVREVYEKLGHAGTLVVMSNLRERFWIVSIREVIFAVLLPGRDGNTRVFMLKTKNGVIKRPIQRIYPLEVSNSSGDIVSSLRDKANRTKKI